MNSIDKGKITGQSHISWENRWFPVDFPLSQPIDEYIELNSLHMTSIELISPAEVLMDSCYLDPRKKDQPCRHMDLQAAFLNTAGLHFKSSPKPMDPNGMMDVMDHDGS